MSEFIFKDALTLIDNNTRVIVWAWQGERVAELYEGKADAIPDKYKPYRVRALGASYNDALDACILFNIEVVE